MNVTLYFWLLLAGWTLASFAASGVRVLIGFSRRDLEAYCQRRRKSERFDLIIERHDQVALAAEVLRIVGATLFVLCLGRLMIPAAGEIAQYEWTAWASALLVGVFLLAGATVWIPTAVVRYWSAPFLFHTWTAWRTLHAALWPLWSGLRIVNALTARLADQPEDEEDEEEAFEDEIRSIVNAGLRDGLLEADAREMIEGVIELGDADVSDIMTPRSHIDALESGQDWPEVLRFIREVGRTRIPVYEQNLDQIRGILYVKDLLPELAAGGGQPQKPLQDLLRDPWFVPNTQPVDELLREFLHNRNHMAIVVDEYRATAGVVTIEDALEEIVGEIIDESDQVEEEITMLDAVSAEALGRTHVDELNEQLQLSLPESDEFDTVAGLVISRLGRIPKSGESVVCDSVRITVIESNRRSIERVRLEQLTYRE